MEYVIRVTETLVKEIIVDADSRESAIEKAKSSYYNDEFELDADNHANTDFRCLRRARESDLTLYLNITATKLNM